MASRTPVIATPAGAAPELINARGGGVLIDHESPEQMAREIVRFARMDEHEWVKISDAALSTTTSHTWNDAADLFEASLLRAFEAARGKPKP